MDEDFGEKNVDFGEKDIDVANFTRKVGIAFLALAGYFIFYIVSQDFRAEGLYNKGIDLKKQQKWEDAIGLFDKALGYDPGMDAAYHMRAICHWQLGHQDQAIADDTEAIDRKPDYVEAYYSRGIFYFAKDDLDHALADFDAFIRLMPDQANG